MGLVAQAGDKALSGGQDCQEKGSACVVGFRVVEWQLAKQKAIAQVWRSFPRYRHHHYHHLGLSNRGGRGLGATATLARCVKR